MAIFEIKSDPYSNPSCVLNALTYIHNDEKSIYNSSCNMFEPSDSSSQMSLIQSNQFSYIKSYYRKHSGKQLEHFVLSFDTTDEEHGILPGTMSVIADCIPYYLLSEYQTVYAVHKPHTGNLNYHIHFIVNTVNIYTGEHFRLNKAIFYSFMSSIADVLRPFHIGLRGYSYFDEQDNFRKGHFNELALYCKTMQKYIGY